MVEIWSPILYAIETQFQQHASAMPNLFPLPLLPTGSRARIDQLLGRAEEVHRLQELGMRIGSLVEMIQPGSPCIVKLEGARLAFRHTEAHGVLVRIGEAE